MSTNVKEVINDLDDLSIRILELMNEQIQCKMNIERCIRSGCLDLAKTRYILGMTQVSAMRIPNDDIRATKTILSTKLEEGKHIFELKKENLNNEGTAINKNKQDPLKWFGILVPSNLRQGQAWFLKAVDLSVQSANISADIVNSIEKYEKLKDMKSLLKEKPEL